MAIAELTQGDTGVIQASSASPEVSQAEITVIFNFPSETIEVSQADTQILQQALGLPVEISFADAEVVFRGKTYDPSLRAWKFELDGHEFYILRLGDDKTYVYDLTTKQWSLWSSSQLTYWKPQNGVNWLSNGGVAYEYGSNVIVGDDNFGIVWALDPTQPYDDSPFQVERDAGVNYYFSRIATAQMTIRARMTNPCYQVYLSGRQGNPAYTGAAVTLSYSDDSGQTFVNAGARQVVAGLVYQDFSWQSLGLIRAPGRLFRITDDGAMNKIEELTVYDGTSPASQ